MCTEQCNGGNNDCADSSQKPSAGEVIEVRLYLDAVSEASKRSRAALYFLVLVMLTIYCCFRYCEDPDWVDARLGTLQTAEACIEQQDFSPTCMKSVKYAEDFVEELPQNLTPKQTLDASLEIERGPIPPDLTRLGPVLSKTVAKKLDKPFPDPHSPFHRHLKQQVDDLIKIRSEALAMHAPILGLTLDYNDLCLFSVVTLLILVYVVGKTLDAERLNFLRARRAIELSSRPKDVELLLMLQVLSIDRRRGPQIVGSIVLLAPIFLQFVIYKDELKTASAGQALIGLDGHNWLLGIELVLIILLGIATSSAMARWLDLLKAIRGLSKDFPTPDSKKTVA